MAGRRWLRQMLGRLGRDQRGNAAMMFGVVRAAARGRRWPPRIDTMLAYSVEDSLPGILDAAGLAGPAPPTAPRTSRQMLAATSTPTTALGAAEFDAEDLE